MRFNIVSNLANGVGLQRNYELLKQALEARGHSVQGVQFNAHPLLAPSADVNIFDEVVAPEAFRAAPKNWVMPHPEWWFAGWDGYKWDLVLAKTHDCERIFRAKVGDKCQYLGWIAKDLYREGIPKERRFLHVAGKSRFKNTHAVIQGCQLARVPLTVIGEHVVPARRVSEQQLIHLMNSHFCHVMPSAYEGYGHVLHESQSTGQVLITTDAPPMNEIVPSYRIPSTGTKPHHAAPLHQVSSVDVANAVKNVAALSEFEVEMLAVAARDQYEEDQKAFYVALDGLVGRHGLNFH
jgi:hypothetical protein